MGDSMIRIRLIAVPQEYHDDVQGKAFRLLLTSWLDPVEEISGSSGTPNACVIQTKKYIIAWCETTRGS